MDANKLPEVTIEYDPEELKKLVKMYEEEFPEIRGTKYKPFDLGAAMWSNQEIPTCDGKTKYSSITPSINVTGK